VRTSSCAGSNGATARVLSEMHTSGFAAGPKPPPESGRTNAASLFQALTQAILLRARCALGQFHQLLKLDALFRFLAAYFLRSLLQTSFVLLKRDPDNVITTYNLTAELGLARACLAVLGQRRNRSCQDCGADDRTEFRS
jgi:hypothetical protein